MPIIRRLVPILGAMIGPLTTVVGTLLGIVRVTSRRLFAIVSAPDGAADFLSGSENSFQEDGFCIMLLPITRNGAQIICPSGRISGHLFPRDRILKASLG
jgi:hypothetical protein